MNRTKLIIWTDIAIFCAFLIAAGIGLSFTAFPGLLGASWKAIHISSGIIVFVGVIFHLVLHRKWIRATAKQLTKKASWLTRMNFGLDFLLGGVLILICLSGLNIGLSHHGYATVFQIKLSLWEAMHRGTGTAMTIYVVIHLALHYQWIKRAVGKYFHFRLGKTPSFGLSAIANDHAKRTLVQK